ncbi:MAG: FHA domain-containing protein [Nevskiales bacterium]|nr:FHA domain-containing protein [Nevskiales bacterium]
MAKLIVTDNSGVTKELPLEKERTTIGRASDNDIPLSDKAVSGHHAVIITAQQGSFLEDLDSTNGTLVNGRQVAKHPLSNNDVISIGRNTLKYQDEGKKDEDDFEKTMVISTGQFGAAFQAKMQKVAAGTPVAASAPGAAAAAPATPTVAKLKVASGPNAGKELVLTKALTTLGRPGEQVAAITRRADGYYILHVGGQEGGGSKRPVVNGREIDLQPVKLNTHDAIELAGVKMNFLLVPAA